ncbi:MAG: M48 family metallopeptidase [Neisseria sp.]|nr:M48 family metallopeptidase [Neisseria sp.]
MMTFSKKICGALLCSAVLVLAGCTAVADLAGYDTRTVNESAKKSYSQVVSQASSQQVLDTRSDTARRVHQVFNRMTPHANAANQTGVPFEWQMSVIRSDELNAWAMPGGKMAVYTGLVEKLKLSDDEIAAIVGHEMTHALQEHSKNAIGQQILTQVAAGYTAQAVAAKTGWNTNSVGLMKDLLTDYGIGKPFSRYQEDLADIGGVRLMAQAGYNPEAAITVWQKMNAANNNNNALVTLLSTHPSNNARIESIRQMLPEVMPIYEQNKIRTTTNKRKK